MATQIGPEVVRPGFLDMQVCVPKVWSDKQVVEFIESEHPCGTKNGWMIRREGSELLSGASERAQCCDKSEFVHIMLDA